MTPDARRAVEWDCTRLINLYANLNDAGRWEEVADLYAEDGAMSRPSAPDVLIVGRQAILDAFRSRPARVSQHVCSNIVISVESETSASGYSTILLFGGAASPDGGLPVRGGEPAIGYFRDRFVLTDQGWRFAERRGGMTFR